MQLNLPTPEGDLSYYKWVATRILSTSTTYTLLIQRRLLHSLTFRKEIGKLLHPSTLFLLDSGVLNITTSMKTGTKTTDLSRYFVVPTMEVSVTLMKLKDGTGPLKRDFYLMLLSEKDMSFDQLPIIVRLLLLKQCTTTEEYSRPKAHLLSGH